MVINSISKVYSFFILFSVLLFSSCGQSDIEDLSVDTNHSWPVKIANSFVLRHPGSVTHDQNYTKDRWDYEQGVILEGLRQVYELTGDENYFDFIKNNIDQFVDEKGKIRTYPYHEFNLDNINTGKQLLYLFAKTGEEKYKIAADTLMKQLHNQPRTDNKGFWHKKRYPYQMWLDGIYMASPFYARYINMFESNKDYSDVTHQIVTVYEKTLDKKTGLLYHAWNENKEQKWADPETGKSAHFWGRAIGWYVMAIVDVLDYLPQNEPRRGELIEILNNVCEALLKVRDKESGLWYQVLDMGDREGNYLEASCATMFTYAFAKGANKGYLPEKYLSTAKDSFERIIEYHVKIDSNGFIDLYHTCAGAGLGGDPYRDGTFEYYISEPQRINDFKGYGPLLFSAVELRKANQID